MSPHPAWVIALMRPPYQHFAGTQGADDFCGAGEQSGAQWRDRNARAVSDAPPQSTVTGEAVSAHHCPVDVVSQSPTIHRAPPAVYNDHMPISARNKLRGQIEEIQLGDVMAHVVIRVGDNLIESVITRRSADELKLKKGDTVSAVVKATEVMIQKD
jgi:molybdopterin-binding protein